MKYVTPINLLLLGLALNLVDLMTAKSDGTGGALFGSGGYLSTVNAALPAVSVPVADVPLNLGGWLVVAGGGWWLWKEFS